MASKAISTAGAKHPLRLLALPLCKNPQLIYYYAHKSKVQGKQPEDAIALNANDSNGSEKAGGASSASSSSTAPQAQGTDMATRVAGLVSKATNKATEQWEKFGKAPQGNWKFKVYTNGERLMDRIEYEEWLLKGLDASTAPLITPRNQGQSPEDEALVPLYYPKALVDENAVMLDLMQMLDKREPHHKSLMKKSLIGAPLTFPFAILPVVPNFPLFYVLWRAWSHWRALKSSQYLKSLIEHNHLSPTSSPILDEIYSSGSPFSSSSSNSKPQILLNNDMITSLIEKFGLEEQAGIDLRRAVSQLEARLKMDKPVKSEESMGSTGAEAKSKL